VNGPPNDVTSVRNLPAVSVVNGNGSGPRAGPSTSSTLRPEGSNTLTTTSTEIRLTSP
jgi:hypothetical protein